MRLAKLLGLLALGLLVAAVIYIYQSPTIERTSKLVSAAPGQAARQVAQPLIAAPRSPVVLPQPQTRRPIGEGGPLIVPVRGIVRTHLTDTWGDSRGGGTRVHQAIDIIAPAGTPVIAAMPGTVEKLFISARGGTTAYVRSHDGGWMAYYAHLQRYADNLREGQAVRRGDVIGYVGDTGNSGAGNYHLHFALARMRPGEKWYQGTPVNPYPLLAGQAPLR